MLKNTANFTLKYVPGFQQKLIIQLFPWILQHTAASFVDCYSRF